MVRSLEDTLALLLGEVIAFIPKLIGAALWLLVGYLVARVVRDLLVRALRAIKFDQVMARAGIERALQAAGTKLDAAGVLAAVVFWFIFLSFIEGAVNALGLTTITAFLNQVLAYLPNVVAAIAILIVGALLANVMAGVARGAAAEAGLTTAGLLGNVARWAILLFAGIAALTQLHVAESTIQILFAGIVAMCALAGGLAFGLGGVDSAHSLLASQTLGAMLQPGQRVQIGSQQGTVIRHDLNATVLDTDQGQIAIPNATLTKEQITVLGNTRG